LPQLIAEVAQARLFVDAHAVDLAFHAGVDQFEIEYGGDSLRVCRPVDDQQQRPRDHKV
jgi:hypothetical protein